MAILNDPQCASRGGRFDVFVEPENHTKAVPQKISSPELTDVGNAEHFVAQQGENLRFVLEWGWMAWDGIR